MQEKKFANIKLRGLEYCAREKRGVSGGEKKDDRERVSNEK